MKEAILNFLSTSQQDQLDLLARLVTQSSHTLDKEGVDSVGKIIINALAECPLSLYVDRQTERGDNLIFRSSGCQQHEKSIILLGHMDTVFPKDSPFRNFHQDENFVYGPGVIDMKGGLVTAIFLLKALNQAGVLDEIPITFICNSDEEMGSVFSTPLIQKEAQHSFCGLVFECGGLNEEIVTGRKGKAGYTLNVYGQAGHAAFTSNNGKASAILELAHKIIAIEQLNDPIRQIVVNAGRVSGGAAPNIVPDKATAEIDIRFLTAHDGEECQKAMEQISALSTITNTRAELLATTSRFPMEPSSANTVLFSVFHNLAKQLGYDISSEVRSGVSDANTLAMCNIPVIDGLGPVGDLDHSDKEYMVTKTLVKRSQLAALGVIELWAQRDSLFK